MITERFKIEVYEGLSEITRMVKASSIERRIGKSCGWFSKRLNRAPLRASVATFRTADMPLLNKAIWEIGERLINTNIENTENRNELAKRVKLALSEVFINYLGVEKLRWIPSKIKDRLNTSETNAYPKHFTPSDIMAINMAAREIGLRLLSMELFAEEEVAPIIENKEKDSPSIEDKEVDSSFLE